MGSELYDRANDIFDATCFFVSFKQMKFPWTAEKRDVEANDDAQTCNDNLKKWMYATIGLAGGTALLLVLMTIIGLLLHRRMARMNLKARQEELIKCGLLTAKDIDDVKLPGAAIPATTANIGREQLYL